MSDRRHMVFLLVRTGITLGLMLATVNWARNSGWGGLTFTLAPVLLAGALLTAICAVMKPTQGFWRARFWGYSAISGALGLVIPNWLVFLTMAQDGVITAAVFYLLSPVFTQALSWLLGLDRLAPLRVAGLVLGTVGALTLVTAPLLGANTDEVAVPYIGLFIPLALAVGNIYRKQRMPTAMPAIALAAGMLLASGVLFVPLLAVALWSGWSGTGVGSMLPLAVQVLLMTCGFVSYFQFLRQVDPVYFSQLGYLVTLTGGLTGVFLFGEAPGWHHGLSVVLVAVGVWLVSKQSRPQVSSG